MNSLGIILVQDCGDAVVLSSTMQIRSSATRTIFLSILAGWLQVAWSSFSVGASEVVAVLPLSQGGIRLLVDSAGDAYVVGPSNADLNHPRGTVLKYGPTLNLLWQRVDETPQTSWSSYTSAVLDSSNHLYTLGNFLVGSEVLMRIVQYDPDGNVVWDVNQRDEASGRLVPHSLALDNDGNVVVLAVSGEAQREAFVIFKFSHVGQLLFRRLLGERPGNTDGAQGCLAVDSTGTIYLAAPSKDDFDLRGYRLIKLSQNGRELWQRAIPNTTGGMSYDCNLVFDLQDEPVVGNSAGLLGYTSAGQLRWAKPIQVKCLIISKSGTIYATGSEQTPDSSIGIGDFPSATTLSLSDAGSLNWKWSRTGDRFEWYSPGACFSSIDDNLITSFQSGGPNGVGGGSLNFLSGPDGTHTFTLPLDGRSSSVALAIDEQGNQYVVELDSHRGPTFYLRRGPAASFAGLLGIVPSGPIRADIGEVVTLKVKASDNLARLASYQWMKDGVNLVGANNDSILIAISGVNDFGGYAVTLHSSQAYLETAETQVGTRTPRISTQPPALVAMLEGEPLTLVGAVDGAEPMESRWLRNGRAVPEVNRSLLLLAQTHTEDSGDYVLRATNQFGTATSLVSRVLVTPRTWLEDWHRSDVPSLSGAKLTRIVWANGQFVALAEGWDETGYILTSKQGIDWQITYTAAKERLRHIVYGNGILLVTGIASQSGGMTGIILFSRDGSVWQQVSDPFPPLTHPVLARDEFVALGFDSASGKHLLFRSPNGREWTSQAGAQDLNLGQLTFWNDTFFAFDSDRSILFSDDALHWQAVSNQESWPTLRYRSFCIAPGGLLAISSSEDESNPYTWMSWSKDGTNWADVARIPGANLLSAAYSGGNYLAVGRKGAIFSSRNLTDWQKRFGRGTTTLNDVTRGEATFVAVGDVGRTLVSGKVNEATLRFEHSVRTEKLELLISAEGGFEIELQTSRDLQHWTPILTFISEKQQTTRHSQTIETFDKGRFYRVLQRAL